MGRHLREESSLSDFDTYRAQAAKARADADAAVLDNVRQRCLRSAEAWDAMASRVQRVSEMRETLEAAKRRVEEGEAPATAAWPKHLESAK